MNGLAASVVAKGWVAWNIEYRRLGPLGGGGGWPGTFTDVAAAVDHLQVLPGIDLGRVVTCGHSAGGQLAVWAAGRGRLPSAAPGANPKVTVQGVVCLAGVLDLERAAAVGLGRGAVNGLLGGMPSERPERYHWASPLALVPLGVRQILVHGLQDTVVPPVFSSDYQRQAVGFGDDVRYLPLTGTGHRDLIDPSSAAWKAASGQLEELLA
jgi:acetyl esterase/lipase